MIVRSIEERAQGKRYLTVTEVSDYLQLSVETIYMYARTGVIPATKIGKHWRFSLDRLEEWMTRQASDDEDAVGIRVLLVEPDLQIAEAFKTWFSEAGCEVYVVASREQAFPLLDEKNFDLVMLDLMDPRLGGLSTLEQIHEMKPRAEIVVAASRFDAELMDRALDIGPLTVLRRPIAKEDVQRLAAAHKQMTERRTADEEEQSAGQDRMPERPVSNDERGLSLNSRIASERLTKTS